MIRRQSGTFRTRNQSRINIMDGAASTSPTVARTAMWTTGATQLDRIALLPPLTDAAQLISFTVNARMALGITHASITDKTQLFGKFGRIIAGLTPQGSETASGDGATDPYLTPVFALPNDLTLVGDLWAPEANELPPSFDFNSLTSPYSGGFNPIGSQVGLVQTLSTPVQVPRGIDLFMGIWMQPSILPADTLTAGSACVLCVLDATYSVLYDDGEK